MDEVRVEIEGRQLTLSNLEKIFYPASGFTKAGVVDYYARIAAVMVPHLAGKAVTLVRAPDGVEGQRFFEKRCPPSAPGWVRSGGKLGSCVVDDAPTLVWLANLAAIELHTHQHSVDDPDAAPRRRVRPRSRSAGGRARLRPRRPGPARAARPARA